MSAIIELVLANSVVAGGLALVALIVSRWSKNPTLAHGLWALVILKLITPPLWNWPVAQVPVWAESKLESVAVQPASATPTVAAQSIPRNERDGRLAALRAALQESPIMKHVLADYSANRAWCVPVAFGWQTDNLANLAHSAALWIKDERFADSLRLDTPVRQVRKSPDMWSQLVFAGPDFPLQRPVAIRLPLAGTGLYSARPFRKFDARGEVSATPIANVHSSVHPLTAPSAEPVAHADHEGTGITVDATMASAEGVDLVVTGSWITVAPNAKHASPDPSHGSSPLWANNVPGAGMGDLEYLVVETSQGDFLIITADEIAVTSPFTEPARRFNLSLTQQDQPSGTLTKVQEPATALHVSIGSQADAPAVWGTRLANVWRDWRGPLAYFWLAGSLACLAIAMVRIHRFRRALSYTSLADQKLTATAQRLGKRLGLRRTPEIRLAPGANNPLVWRGLWKTYLLLPAELVRSLTRQQAATLLAHELAHLRRLDHVMRWLELAATILYWWNPLLWLARKQLRQHEELCCDAWVVWAMPQAARDYLDTVLKTVDFLADRRSVLPLAATGMGHFHELKVRFQTVIENHQQRQNHNRFPRHAKAALLLLGLALLPLVPTLDTLSVVKADGALVAQTENNGETKAAFYMELAPPPAQANRVLAATLGMTRPTLPAQLSFDTSIESLAASRDGRWLALGRTDGTVEVRSLEDSSAAGTVAWIDSVHESKPVALAFSADGDLLASVAHDGNLVVRRVANGDICFGWQSDATWLTSVAFSPDGEYLAVGGYDRLLRVFARSDSISTPDTAAAAPPGFRLPASSYTAKLIAYSPLPVCWGTHESAIQAIEFAPDGDAIATVDSAGALSLWNSPAAGVVDGLTLQARVPAHRGVARDVAFANDASTLATVGEDGALKLWRRSDAGLELQRETPLANIVTQVTFAPRDQVVLVGGWDGQVQFVAADSGRVLRNTAQESFAASAALHPLRDLVLTNNRLFFAGGQDPGLSQWRIRHPGRTGDVHYTVLTKAGFRASDAAHAPAAVESLGNYYTGEWQTAVPASSVNIMVFSSDDQAGSTQPGTAPMESVPVDKNPQTPESAQPASNKNSH